MVNEAAKQLLDHLKNAPAPVSGEALARGLGISRVALWKRVESLRAAGYPVEADRRGYRLGTSDKPLPWEFPGDEDRTFHFETLGSTMDEALRLGLEGLAEGAVVAERQNAGRGRADRSWQSGGGDLLVTLVLRPKLPVSYAGALGLEALAALGDTLDELYHVATAVKWPNDLVAPGVGAKVAGVLVEAWGPLDSPRFYTVGLGLNVHGLPDLDRPTASVDGLGPVRADRRAILASWRARMGRWCAAPTLSPDRWSRGLVPRPTAFETFDGRTLSGTPQGYDRTGSLVLGASIPPVRYGEIRRTHLVSGDAS
jgi:BirA family biotin operon repressor/biotin-[acetyl-CoA-carboxylase] ligase